MRKYNERKIVKCAFCGTLLSKCPSQVRNNNFCSHSCQGNYNKTLTAEKCHNWKGADIQKTCSVCGKLFKVKQHRRETAQYCSTGCMGISQKKLTGSNARNWKGGLTQSMKAYRIMAEAKRRAKKRAAFGTVTIKEWELIKKENGYTCASCGEREPNITLTQDHIVPLSRGGPNLSNNIQPLCMWCNAKKHTRTIYFKQGFEIKDMDAIPSEYLKIDKQKIGQVVRALKGATNIPGVEVYSEDVVSGRAAA